MDLGHFDDIVDIEILNNIDFLLQAELSLWHCYHICGWEQICASIIVINGNDNLVPIFTVAIYL